jgi:GNAT superfamily N-acetyltransferase
MLAPMQVVDFEPRYAEAFKALNEEWITRHFTMEAKDAAMLADPVGLIIDRGGRILMLLDEGRPVGCCALLPLADGGLELAKMAVTASVQGKGLGRALMQAAIDRARAAGAPRLWLETNSALAPALSLYRSTGFRDVPPVRGSDYARADVVMELRL